MRPSWQRKLLMKAEEALGHAYAPHSGLRVGAAVLLESGRAYVGCNVENDSYGLTICAERAAVLAAVAGEGLPVERAKDRDRSIRIKAVAIASSRPNAVVPPCGACRQVIAQFGPTAKVIYLEGDRITQLSIKRLLPERFALH